MTGVVQADMSRDAETVRPACREFIPAYVISLADAEARRRNMTARLAAVGLPFHFFDAVDGRARRLPDLIDGARVVRTPFGTEAALACTASHRLLHRMIAESAAETTLVLEDDATIPEDFVEVIEQALDLDFDVFKLEGINVSKRRITVGRVGRHDVIITNRPSVGSAAYLLRRDAARRICSLPVIDQTSDYVFQDTRLRLRVLEMNPFCVQQDGATDTQILHQPNLTYVAENEWSIRRWIGSLKRKAVLASIYGPAVLARLEFQRIERWLNRSARSPRS
jgi:GR25 family glycosyltransferase involved in LPS biosynthesis